MLENEKAQASTPDFEELSRNMARFIEGAGKAAAAYFKPLEDQTAKPRLPTETEEAIKIFGHIAESWMSDPHKSMEAQGRLGVQFFELWASALKRAQGESPEPVAKPDPRDNRFQDPEWSANPIFDFLKQAYLIISRWAEEMVDGAEGIDEQTRHRAQFYLRQISSALSPSNFLLTNPELIRETFRQNGANLVRGITMLAEDIEAGAGELRIRQSDPTGFKIGVNIATTPGKVIFRNELMELIQYSPTTDEVLKRPLLIVPPWINKFYILDLNPEKSFIRWAVSQGLTVFCISWVNPDAQHADKSFEHYMHEGIFAALDVIQEATGEKKVTAIGYCVGGTLLATTLAYMAAKRDKRIDSATFFTAQVDFTFAGDLKVFAGETQIKSLEASMKMRGYLEGSQMANAFNMLRPNDLIWPYVINVYMKGHAPFPFDLLYWNSDSTRMPAANHAFYLRNCYLENKLAKGEMEVGGVKLGLKKIKIPIFNLATKEDHIAPARSVFVGSKMFGGPVEFVLAGSGHIAGVVNPVSKPKYQFWTGGPVEGELADWVQNATETPGTWWPYWLSWIKAQAPKMVPAREPGGGKLPTLGNAPGTYVLMRS
ncbi:class I poly(R)-hydroxyalkanoic acid synthase [Microvirga sp. c23x22]|uniref:Class I poly(R)-hydroxyalkanoic acid synthase n=2 Tax=Microvirga terricola TaxID=2719797 RepID=A0ABX0VEK6_9HYPH|nr:class I poly(R)-hydroxyalkanoic acid synthase [Microvirga terricola]NIX77599.1 class I poly(R)-hydroxyalkanoic acid synthase [Microvirga terricola]